MMEWMMGYMEALETTKKRIQMRHDDTKQNSSYIAGYKEALRDVITLLQDEINKQLLNEEQNS